MEGSYHPPEELFGKFGSKQDLYNLVIANCMTSTINFFLFSALLTFKLSKDIIGFHESNPYKEEKDTSLIFIPLILLVLRTREIKYIVVPKYIEPNTAKIWPLVQEIEDLNSYFANMKENEFSEREYLWKIVSTLRPDSIKELIKTVRKNRTTKEFIDQNDFIQIDPSIYQEISAIAAQKSKCISLEINTIFDST